MIYSKTGSKIKHSIVVKDVEANYILATDKFIVDYYLSNFENIKYTTFDVSRNTSTILTTLTATDFRKNPSSQAILIKKLPKGSELQYLDRSPQQDSLLVGKERWIWLKVRDNKKQEGWIWGHPSIVKEYY
ncbi:SH3 domain-containing protein [Parasediminibacterium paludis]|uniref:SH3 domain-containing protein n=1 Tax=Parasediminibacterium paludis TaxID=908966 RepID=A0ABV8PWZ7_9BACT